MVSSIGLHSQFLVTKDRARKSVNRNISLEVKNENVQIQFQGKKKKIVYYQGLTFIPLTELDFRVPNYHVLKFDSRRLPSYQRE